MKRWRLGLGAIVCLATGLALGMMLRDGRPTALLSAAAAVEATQKTTPRPTPPDDGKLRIICFGAHPDDCEIQAGGVAALWSAKGHHVKFVSVTNGDIGHWRDAGGPLARRRTTEVGRAAQILGNAAEVLDIHD